LRISYSYHSGISLLKEIHFPGYPKNLVFLACLHIIRVLFSAVTKYFRRKGFEIYAETEKLNIIIKEGICVTLEKYSRKRFGNEVIIKPVFFGSYYLSAFPPIFMVMI
jgi:hypothetical protein